MTQAQIPTPMPLPPGSGPLARTPGPAEAWEIFLGRHRLTGSGSSVSELSLAGELVARNIGLPGGGASGARLLPGRVDVASGGFTVLAGPDLDAASILVNAQGPAREAELELTLPGEPRRGGPGALSWGPSRETGRMGALRITPPPAQVQGTQAEGGTRLKLTWQGLGKEEEPSSHRAAVLLATGRNPEDLERALQRGSSIPLRAHRVLAEALGEGSTRLGATFPGTPMDSALGWAAAALPSSDDPSDLDSVLARLALGLEPPSPEAVLALAEDDPSAFLLAVSALSAWVGDSRGLSPLLPEIPKVLGRIPRDAPGAAALLGAAAAAEAAGDRRLASRLRLRAAGGDRPALEELRVAACPPVAEVAPMPGGPAGARTSAADTLEAMGAAAGRTGMLAREIMGPRPSRASLRELPGRFLFGDLGARGDAPVGRLHLAPRIPLGRAEWQARNLPLGDCRVTLSCLGNPGLTTFSFEQTEGAVPLNLVFEPVMAAQPTEIRLDGIATDLRAELSREGWTVRVQLPLDGVRRVEISRE